MDANGTRYHLLLGRDNWSACSADERGLQSLRDIWDKKLSPVETAQFDWDVKRSELTLESRLFQFIAAPRDVPPVIEDRRGAASDRFGNWYWISQNGSELLVNSSGSGNTTHFWSAEDTVIPARETDIGEFGPKIPPQPPKALQFSGLCVTDPQYLVVGTLSPPGLLIFDLYTGGSPREMLWPVLPFAPWDMSPSSDGGLWILDRLNHRYWALDCYLNVIHREQVEVTLVNPDAGGFQPLEGEVPEHTGIKFPQGITLDDSSPIDLEDPISIEGLPDGTILILDYQPAIQFAVVHRYRYSQHLARFSTDVMLDKIEGGVEAAFKLLGHDMTFVSNRVVDKEKVTLGQVYIAASNGNQTFAFDLVDINDTAGSRTILEPLPRYYPMRLFGGKGIIVNANQVHYDFDNRWIPLVEQKRPRYALESELYTPIIQNPLVRDQAMLDGHEPDCVWHRLMIDGCISPDTEVVIFSRASNDLNLLPYVEWSAEPALYKRGNGSELPYTHKIAGYDTYELLFQQARGQYMQLHIILRGNEQSTPRLRALRAYYGRFSYLNHYLPTIYRYDLISASFVDRFLANFEGLFTALEDKIAAVQALFDVRSAPADALDWLAGWFGVIFDKTWENEEVRKRLFIQNAMTFFQMRGTLGGVQLALQLVMDECPNAEMFSMTVEERERATGIRIIENFRTRQTPAVALGDSTEPVGLVSVSISERWHPEQGSGGLQERYESFLKGLQERGITIPMPSIFGLVSPKESDAAVLWRQFCQDVLGFIPSATSSDLGLWRAFLARRYGYIDALNDASRFTGNARYLDFAEVLLPNYPPSSGALLKDWVQFESIVLAMHRNAHRFTVLLPMPRSEYLDAQKQSERLALARRVVELDKPSHTTFEVKFYWALFRVGGVRVGYDTVIGQGSRDPQLMSAIVLGRGHLMESYLSSTHIAPGRG